VRDVAIKILLSGTTAIAENVESHDLDQGLLVGTGSAATVGTRTLATGRSAIATAAEGPATITWGPWIGGGP